MMPAFARRAMKSNETGGRRQGHNHHAGGGARFDERVCVLLQHRADEFGRMHALALGIDERPLDMDSERARDAFARLASGGERRVQHARRVGHDRRQKPGHPARRCAAAIAAIPSTVGSALNRTPPPPLICQSMKPGLKNPAAEVDLLAAAGAVFKGDKRLDRRAFEHECAVVAQSFAVEDPRAVENFHSAASRRGATAPPTNRIAPSVAS